MNLFQLSIRSVIRKPIKSMLLLLIIFVTAVFFYSGWACKNATIQTQNRDKQAVGASFRLQKNETNRQKRIEALSKQIGDNVSGSAGGYHQQQLPSGAWRTSTDHSFETLDLDDIGKLSTVDGVRHYNITTANTVVNPVNFNRFEDEEIDQSSDARGVSLRGNWDMAYDFDVQKGNIVVNAGRMIENGDADVCVISSELAALNHLALGDKLEFNNWKERDTSTVYTATIIGIYDSKQKITPIMAGDSYRSENIIFTDLRFPEKPEGSEGNPLFQYATFWVEDVNQYEEVKEKLKAVNIDWGMVDFLDNAGMSNTVAGNFNNLSGISSVVLLFVMVSSIFILLFVFLFWMKNRMFEMGVLLSIGRSKLQIIVQILLEGIFIGMVSFMLATLAAPAVSQGVAQYLVGYQIQAADEKEQAEKGMVAESYTETDDEVLGVTVNIEKDVVVFSFLSTIGVILIAILGSSIYVIIQKPKAILSKMS